MFLHNFKYSLKVLLRNKGLLFWTFAFPVILGLLFNLAFSNIENSEEFNTIEIAIINNDNFFNDEYYKQALESLTKNKILNIKYTSKDEAVDLLEKKAITAYADGENLVINSNGVNETIVKYIFDELKINKEAINKSIENELYNNINNGQYEIDYEIIYSNIMNKLNDDKVTLKDNTSKNLSYTMIEYYTLIALAALYGGAIALNIIDKSLPNTCSVGKRINVSSIKRSTLILSGLLASYIVQIIGMIIVFLFTIFVIHVDYGDNIGMIVLVALLGSFASLCFGVMLSSCLKANENTKSGILIALTMLFSFFAGMTGISMKYIIDKNVPIINIINPCNMMVDSFYTMYYYGINKRLYFNLVSLVVFSAVMILISLKTLRRQKYDSI